MRKEIKFEINREEYDNINKKLSEIADKSQSILKKEQYTVKSIYFDNIYNLALQENIDGVSYREKYRIRMYDNNEKSIFLEKKIKKEDSIFKFRERITKQDVIKICNIEIDNFLNETDLKKDFYINTRTKLLKPKLIIEYDRIAFEHNLTNTRITLDSSLNKDENILDFFKECNKNSKIYKYILEVKYEDVIPKFILESLKINIQRQKSSKYVTMRLNK